MLLADVLKVPPVSFLADWYRRRPLQFHSQDVLAQNAKRFDSKYPGLRSSRSLSSFRSCKSLLAFLECHKYNLRPDGCVRKGGNKLPLRAIRLD